MLPSELREASGVALSRTHDDVLWTHNDSDAGANLYAVDTDGALIHTFPLPGANNHDWEDIAVGPCPADGPDGDCIFIADIGDNRAVRDDIGLYVLAEPDPRSGSAPTVVFIPLRYPDGAHDAEAIAVAESGSLLLVTKGRDGPITVFRSPALSWPRHAPAPSVDLLFVQRLSDGAADLPDQVTGAAISARRGRIAIRSYAGLQFHRIDGDTLAAVLAIPFALDGLGEPQGEGVAIDDRGRVFLASEAGPQAIAPRLTRLRCRMP